MSSFSEIQIHRFVADVSQLYTQMDSIDESTAISKIIKKMDFLKPFFDTYLRKDVPFEERRQFHYSLILFNEMQTYRELFFKKVNVSEDGNPNSEALIKKSWDSFRQNHSSISGLSTEVQNHGQLVMKIEKFLKDHDFEYTLPSCETSEARVRLYEKQAPEKERTPIIRTVYNRAILGAVLYFALRGLSRSFWTSLILSVVATKCFPEIFHSLLPVLTDGGFSLKSREASSSDGLNVSMIPSQVNIYDEDKWGQIRTENMGLQAFSACASMLDLIFEHQMVYSRNWCEAQLPLAMKRGSYYLAKLIHDKKPANPTELIKSLATLPRASFEGQINTNTSSKWLQENENYHFLDTLKYFLSAPTNPWAQTHIITDDKLAFGVIKKTGKEDYFLIDVQGILSLSQPAETDDNKVAKMLFYPSFFALSRDLKSLPLAEGKVKVYPIYSK